MTSTLDARTVVGCSLKRPLVGAWHARIDAEALSEDPPAPGAPVVLTLEGTVYKGTVIRANVDGAGHLKARIVGGAGKLATKLPARNYDAGPTARAIIQHMLAEAGERLSRDSDESVLATFVNRWERLGDDTPVSRCLVHLLDSLGAIWRVQPDGTVWVGKEQYPESDVAYTLIDEDFGTGTLELAPGDPGETPGLADLAPGTRVEGQPIRYVEHELQETQLRTLARLESPGGLLERYLAGIRQEIAYAGLFPARVVQQNADGTLQVMPDDPKLRGSGMNRVPIRLGIPGTVEVAAGTRVRIGFEGPADARRAFAALFDDGQVVRLNLGDGTVPIALSTPVDSNFTALLLWAATHVHSGVTTGGGTSGTGTPPPSLASVGSAAVFAE